MGLGVAMSMFLARLSLFLTRFQGICLVFGAFSGHVVGFACAFLGNLLNFNVCFRELARRVFNQIIFLSFSIEVST